MPYESMNIDELAKYLKQDARDVHKLANKGSIPGKKVGGEWRFHRNEINYWIESNLHEHENETLLHFESHAPIECERGLLVSKFLGEACIASPLKASTRASVLKELITLAEQSWQIYDPTAIHAALVEREGIASTALAGGIAIPHPHHPIKNTLGESIISLGIVPNGIPFGAPDGKLTSIFFLVCCIDDKTHLQVLARLTRLFRKEGFLDALREMNSQADIWHLVRQTELSLMLPG